MRNIKDVLGLKYVGKHSQGKPCATRSMLRRAGAFTWARRDINKPDYFSQYFCNPKY